MDFIEVNRSFVDASYINLKIGKIAVRLVNAVTPTNKVKNTNISANYNNSAKVTSAIHSLYHVTLTLCVTMLFIKF